MQEELYNVYNDISTTFTSFMEAFNHRLTSYSVEKMQHIQQLKEQEGIPHLC
jgi:hypothetical protein